MPPAVDSRQALYADTLIKYITCKNGQAAILQRSNRTTARGLDRHQYRNVIKRIFATFKQFRLTATLYDKIASRYIAVVTMAASHHFVE